MYDELVKRLKEEASNPDTYPEDFILMRKAADAIEEMQKKYDGAVSDNKSLCRQIAELAKERNEAYSTLALGMASGQEQISNISEQERKERNAMQSKCGTGGQTMYEELVESSRLCAMGYNGACDGCIFCGKSNDKDGDCYQQLHKAAADAIEELSRRIERAVDLYNRNVEKTAMYEALIGLSPEPSKEDE